MGRGRRGCFDDSSRHRWLVTFLICTVGALLPGVAWACSPMPALDGVLTIPQCEPHAPAADCMPATTALYDGLQAFDIPDVFTVGLQTSPWRMYDAEGRILTVEEVADAIRAGRPETDRRVHLVGSWTASRPDGGTDTLASRLSLALDGLPVDGSDGFLWLDRTGHTRTTRQAASTRMSGPYAVRPTDEVMMAQIPGALIDYEAAFVEQVNAAALVHVGMGYDAFLLCPERALAAFEHAAGLGSAIGAYNAGLMHAGAGRRQAATTWLERAISLGEPKAASALAKLAQDEQGR